MDSMQKYLIEYIGSFTFYDYLAYLWLIVLFFILIALSLLMIKRNVFITLFLVFFSFLILFFSPFGIKHILDSYVRKTSIELEKPRYLHFSKSLIISGKLTNDSKIDYNKCIIYIDILENSSNKYLNYVNRLKPLREKSIVINKKIEQGGDYSFRIVIDNFNLKDDYNISAKADCY